MCRPERLFRCAVVVLLVLCGSYLAAEVGVAGAFGLPLDDGWIHCAYARNLASGAGFSLAQPGVAVPGSTAPLWTALLAGLFVLLGPGLLAAKVLGIGTALLALWAVSRLARAATGDATLAGLCALVLAATPRFVQGAVSGMEVPLYIALCALGLAAHLQHRCAPGWRWHLAPVWLALSGWARPELFVLVGLVALDRMRCCRQRPAAALLAAAAALLSLVPYPAWHLWLYGHPLPTTFYVKAADGSSLAVARSQGVLTALLLAGGNAVRELAAFLGYVPGHLPLLAVGLWAGFRRGRRERNGVPFLLGCLAAFAVARGLLSYTGPWVQSGRYFAHAWPLLLVVLLHGVPVARGLLPLTMALAAVAAAAAVVAATVLPDPGLFLWDVGQVTPALATHEPWWIALPAAVVVLAALAGGGGALTPAPARARRWAFGLCGIYLLASHIPGAWLHARHVLDTNTVHVAMAHEIARRTPPDALIACHDIGAIGFWSGRPLLDLAGIASPELLFELRQPGQPPQAAAHLLRRKPRYLCVLDGWLGKLFPDPRALPGLGGWQELFRITHHDNRTVGGEQYFLLELQWQ